MSSNTFVTALLVFSACICIVVAENPSFPGGNQDDCNWEKFHTHQIMPVEESVALCKRPDASFVLCHGATFFCPHTYDIKQYATIVEDDARATICESYFNALARNQSIKHAFRPFLGVNGLPASGSGYSTSWVSNVTYHVWSFGPDGSSGPGNGWNTTTIRNVDTTVRFKNLYFRQFELATPQPPQLSYLIYPMKTLAGRPRVLLTKYVTSAPDFEHLLWAELRTNVKLREQWPLRIEINGRRNVYEDRLKQGETVDATLFTSANDGVLRQVPFKLAVTLDYYSGIADGFADFDVNCHYPLPHPQNKRLCSP